MFFESLTPALAASLLPVRDENTDKMGFGKLLCVCGSHNMPGAAVLSIGGALRAGVGLCTIASVESVCRAVTAVFPGAVLNILPESKDGGINPLASQKIAASLSHFSAVLIGCGVGITGGGRVMLRTLLKECTKPLIIDADGLNLLCEDTSLLKDAKCPIVLTPHQRELERLLEASGMPDAQTFAREYGVTVVAKGARTEIHGTKNYVLDAHNTALAKGGSGDILAGIIASLCAQGADTVSAAAASVYIHSKAGALASGMLGVRSVLVTDILDKIGVAFNEIEGKI